MTYRYFPVKCPTHGRLLSENPNGGGVFECFVHVVLKDVSNVVPIATNEPLRETKGLIDVELEAIRRRRR
jgi:hypothetical protein